MFLCVTQLVAGRAYAEMLAPATTEDSGNLVFN